MPNMKMRNALNIIYNINSIYQHELYSKTNIHNYS